MGFTGTPESGIQRSATERFESCSGEDDHALCGCHRRTRGLGAASFGRTRRAPVLPRLCCPGRGVMPGSRSSGRRCAPRSRLRRLGRRSGWCDLQAGNSSGGCRAADSDPSLDAGCRRHSESPRRLPSWPGAVWLGSQPSLSPVAIAKVEIPASDGALVMIQTDGTDLRVVSLIAEDGSTRRRSRFLRHAWQT